MAKPLKCVACGGPRTGISREIDRTRKNALCQSCYQATGICECGCGKTFPLYNGHGTRRRFYRGDHYRNVPELAEKARKRRSKSMKKAWNTKQYRLARQNPDKYAKTPREQRVAGKQRFKELYRANPKKYKDMAERYRKSHPEVYVAMVRRRNLRKRGTTSKLTLGQWREILKVYHHRCAYCGTSKKKLTQDHIIPLSKGGEHTIQNVIPACMPCNREKWDGPPPIPVQPVLL